MSVKQKVIGIVVFLALIALDQWTKYLAVIHLKDTEGIPLISQVFHLEYLENHGAGFGVLQNQQVLLLVISGIILIGVIYLYCRIPADKRYTWMRVVCVVLAAGAVGNMIDRICHRYVIDFFSFCLINFPIFNVADCYVTVAFVMLIILVLFYYKDEDFEFLKRKQKEDA